MRDELKKYVEVGVFDQFKEQNNRYFKELEDLINSLKGDQKNTEKRIDEIEEKVNKACQEVAENNAMMKEINFNEMQQKIKKFKEDSDTKLSEFGIRLKKKVGSGDLLEIEKNIIEKIDRYLVNEKPKADQTETKDALSFLEKRIN